MKVNEERFREVERRAVDVIEVITHAGLRYEESEVEADVYEAIQKMKREAELKKAQEAARNFYRLGIDDEKIAQGLDYAVETVKGWLGLPSET
ncbi:MAG: hypothetical protein HFG41_00175 [Coprococcus sp.]|nr:hypothetical protein [Coprococcus sp.]